VHVCNALVTSDQVAPKGGTLSHHAEQEGVNGLWQRATFIWNFSEAGLGQNYRHPHPGQYRLSAFPATRRGAHSFCLLLILAQCFASYCKQTCKTVADQSSAVTGLYARVPMLARAQDLRTRACKALAAARASGPEGADKVRPVAVASVDPLTCETQHAGLAADLYWCHFEVSS
jgi:hypothetical protein